MCVNMCFNLFTPVTLEKTTCPLKPQFPYQYKKGTGLGQVSSVQFSRSVVSDSLRPHELQHARPPCPSPAPRVPQTHVHRGSDAIQPSHPLSSPFPLAPNPSQPPDPDDYFC